MSKSNLVNLPRNIARLALLAPFAVLSNCSDSSDGSSERLGPASLDGLSISFANASVPGPTLSFSAFRGTRGFSNGVESGAVVAYSNGGTVQPILLVVGTALATDPAGAAYNISHGWANDDNFDNATYTYTTLGDSSGILTISVDSNGFADTLATPNNNLIGEDVRNFFSGASATGGNPFSLTILFDSSNGNTIEMGQAVITTSPLGEMAGNGTPSTYVEDEFTFAGSEAPLISLTSGGPVPLGFETDFDGPSTIIPGSFDGRVLRLVDTSGSTLGNFTVTFSEGTGGGSIIIGGDSNEPVISSGTALTTSAALGVSFEGTDYEIRQTIGTDDASLDLNFTSAPVGIVTLPSDLAISLIFNDPENGTFTGQNDNGETLTGVFTLNDI